jgi:chemotaxis protein CheX
MDVKYINPFLNGTLEVLKKMAFMDARPGKVYLKESNVAAGDVSGIIGVTGDATGSLAISFTESCICNIVGRMLGESHTTVNQEVFDAVGEITNMISGVARTYLEKQGMTVYAAIPTVIYGKNHTIDPVTDSPSIIIPFSTDKGDFVVDVCIKTTEQEARNAEDYQVMNRKTLVPQRKAAIPEVRPDKPDAPPKTDGKDSPPSVRPDAPPAADRKELLKNKLKEFTTARDQLIKQLAENPFMEISKRTALKKQIPQYDARIKRLMLDISAIEMIANISSDELENPVIAQHFQHYDNKKRRP